MTLSNDKETELNSSAVKKISLLEEKLLIARHKEKTGEVVIRKKVETRIAKIPLRREKLIIERVGKNPQQLTEVIVAEETVNGFKYDELTHSNDLHYIHSKFISLSTAQDLLTAISHLSSANNIKVRLEIVTNCSESQTISEIKNLCD